jgi:acyl transferase domain-containing protein
MSTALQYSIHHPLPCNRLRSCWAGPAVSIDTACSSALVGVHMGAAHAAKADVSTLAAGVNLMLAERTSAATQVVHAHTAGPEHLAATCI